MADLTPSKNPFLAPTRFPMLDCLIPGLPCLYVVPRTTTVYAVVLESVRAKPDRAPTISLRCANGKSIRLRRDTDGMYRHPESGSYVLFGRGFDLPVGLNN